MICQIIFTIWNFFRKKHSN